jgi:hypothetical protein
VVLMRQSVRWAVAGLLVLAFFAVVTWVIGVVLLPHWRALSAADRWVVATAAGLAVAALPALWGKEWASRAGVSQAAGSGGRAVTVSRDNTGIISTGDSAINTQDR